MPRIRISGAPYSLTQSCFRQVARKCGQTVILQEMQHLNDRVALQHDNVYRDMILIGCSRFVHEILIDADEAASYQQALLQQFQSTDHTTRLIIAILHIESARCDGKETPINPETVTLKGRIRIQVSSTKAR